MLNEIRQLTDRYHDWLSDNTLLQIIEDSVEITMPFLDRHNDHMQIYAERSEGGFLLSDDGYTIDDLELSGCNLDTATRTELLNTTLNGFGVSRNGNALQVKATLENFAFQKQNLLQAMLSVNDLHYTSLPVVASMFAEDVAAWLDTSNIAYERGVEFTGRSGYKVYYDFVIPESDSVPNLAIWSIGSPDAAAAKSTAFDWEDTRGSREDSYRAFAILNDKGRHVPISVLTAFSNYGIQPLPYSTCRDARSELAA